MLTLDDLNYIKKTNMYQKKKNPLMPAIYKSGLKKSFKNTTT